MAPPTSLPPLVRAHAGYGRWELADGSWLEGQHERGSMVHGKMFEAPTKLEYEGE